VWKAALDGRFQLVLSPAILREVRLGFFKTRIRKKYPLTLRDIATYLAALRQAAEVVPGHLEVHYGSRDPKDNPVLACAVEGRAAYLVTDDRRDLLPMGHYHGTEIVSVPDFLRRLESHES
jgi:putative PIN family toxin of toxin-antitoxin system